MTFSPREEKSLSRQRNRSGSSFKANGSRGVKEEQIQENDILSKKYLFLSKISFSWFLLYKPRRETQIPTPRRNEQVDLARWGQR